MHQNTLAYAKKRKVTEPKVPKKNAKTKANANTNRAKRKILRKQNSIIGCITTKLYFILSKNPQERVWINKLTADRAKIHGDQFNDKKYTQHKKELHTTYHADFRFMEKFNPHGYTMEQIREDISKGRRRVRMASCGRFKVIGHLGKYIITKDKVVVTMYPLEHDFNR